MTIDHTCNQRSCQNVEHMELVPREENFRRSIERRIQREPVCPRCGGEWTEEVRGGRKCPSCVAERRREAREGGFE
jgi:predicted Zn-ribbon and HTH transcriptional regulator